MTDSDKTFEPGDRVVVTGDTQDKVHEFPANTEAEVVTVDEWIGNVLVTTDPEVRDWQSIYEGKKAVCRHVHPDDLELVTDEPVTTDESTIKPGDYIKVVKDATGNGFEGKTVRVLGKAGENRFLCSVLASAGVVATGVRDGRLYDLAGVAWRYGETAWVSIDSGLDSGLDEVELVEFGDGAVEDEKDPGIGYDEGLKPFLDKPAFPKKVEVYRDAVFLDGKPFPYHLSIDMPPVLRVEPVKEAGALSELTVTLVFADDSTEIVSRQNQDAPR